MELVGDLPIIAAQAKRLDLSALFDEYFPDHGHWKGISGGTMVLGWLMYILTESDHRLSHVEDWAEVRLNTLGRLLGVEGIRGVDFCDDRLGRYLDRLANDENWNKFEHALGKHVLLVYSMDQLSEEPEGRLLPQVIRTDSFNVPQYREEGELCRHGYTKQRRSDQPFYKTMVSALDPHALPLVVDVVAGSGPDSDHYLPAINRVRSMFDTPGQLYIGDSQLGSLPNRSALHKGGDYYLCPLGSKQLTKAQRDGYLDMMPHSDFKLLPKLSIAEGEKRADAYFYELSLSVCHEEVEWKERHIMVYSPNYAQGLMKSFANRLNEAEEKIANLVVSKSGRKVPRSEAELRVRIAAIEEKFEVENCFDVSCIEKISQITVRRHKDRPERIEQVKTLSLSIKRNTEFIDKKMRRLGWQVYATNIPVKVMDTSLVVKTYRNQYRIEHLFDYIINRDTGLLPVFLKKEGRVKALIRLLMVAMRLAVTIQQTVRQKLADQKSTISGVYPGNKGRKTNLPTSAMLLSAFKNIQIAVFHDASAVLTPLSETQLKILELLGNPRAYDQLLETPKNLRET